MSGDENNIKAERLTWKDIETYLKKDDRVLLVVGAVEQHGPHLAMGTDTMTAMSVANDAGLKTGVIVYPPIWYGWSEKHMGFPGTVSIRPETLQAFIEDIVESLTEHGFKRFIILNGNRRVNLPPLQISASKLMRKCKRLVFVADIAYLNVNAISSLRTSEPGGIGHAGEIETSHMMYIHPDCVKIDKSQSRIEKASHPRTSFMPSDPKHEGTDSFFMPPRPATFYKVSGGSGIAGDPTKANQEKGKKLHYALVDGLVNLLNVIKSTSIH